MTKARAERLWSDSASERLSAACALAPAELDAARAHLRADAPATVRTIWPYGYATSINPLLVTLGISPGSARSWKGKDPSKLPFEAPTAGKPHPHIARLGCSTRFGKWVQHLAREVLQTGDLAEEHAYALFGNLVLDPRSQRQGQQRPDRPGVRVLGPQDDPGPPASPLSRVLRHERPSDRYATAGKHIRFRAEGARRQAPFRGLSEKQADVRGMGNPRPKRKSNPDRVLAPAPAPRAAELVRDSGRSPAESSPNAMASASDSKLEPFPRPDDVEAIERAIVFASLDD